MKQLLNQLFEHQNLDRESAKEALLQIGKGDFNEAEIASFLTVFRMRAISVEEIRGFQDALLELCLPFDLQGRTAIDIVGTGGDNKNTFNISTLSAFVVAGAGYLVCKHGNYGVSSSCGSSDVLEKLGYRFSNASDTLHRQLDKAGICFLHAPHFHPAMKRVASIRKQLGVKTFFNMLGPLVNPAQPRYQLFGVYSPELARLYQYVLQANEKEFGVVYALDGYDEVSLTGLFQFRTNVGEVLLEPKDLGMESIQADQLHGGSSVEEAASIFRNILENKGTPAQESVVIANAGLAIHSMDLSKSYADCLEEARESLRSGKALGVLEGLVELCSSSAVMHVDIRR
ncbi:MAG: anthranilate phosphoribosyltransferase [Saprospiraceae bacterium]|nr:anthranilate phosphoribosyltransferase [Saprospiraceae bacterium]